MHLKRKANINPIVSWYLVLLLFYTCFIRADILRLSADCLELDIVFLANSFQFCLTKFAIMKYNSFFDEIYGADYTLLPEQMRQFLCIKHNQI